MAMETLNMEVQYPVQDYYALNTKNLAEYGWIMAYTNIDKPSDYFNTKLYTGNGGTQTITGVGFQPDLTMG
jgi:hypothetical protein